MVVLGRDIQLRWELRVIIACYLFLLVFLFIFGPKKPTADPVTAPRQSPYWSVYEERGGYDLREYGCLVDGWLQATFAEHGYSVAETSWTLQEKREKKWYLWTEAEYHVGLQADDPLQNIDLFYRELKAGRDGLDLEMLYADGVLLEGTVYYRMDLGITTPAGSLVTQRVFVQLPKLTSAEQLKKWAVASPKPKARLVPEAKKKEGLKSAKAPPAPQAKPLKITPKKKRPVVKKKPVLSLIPVVKPQIKPEKKVKADKKSESPTKGQTAKVTPKPPVAKKPVEPSAKAVVVPPPPRKPVKPVRPPQTQRRRGSARVAIIIDDFGFVWEPAEAFFEINEPLTIAVMPGGEYSGQHARRAAEVGFEVILHQPLEPNNMDRNNPGPGLIHSGLTDQEIISVFRANLADVPGAVGFNNHMGSKGSRDPRIMDLLLREAKRTGLFFVDSRSISGTVGEDIARNLGVPHAGRDVFLDNDLAHLRRQLDILIRIARRDGEAIGIAHARPGRAAVIKEYLPKFREAGIEIVPVSALLKK